MNSMVGQPRKRRKGKRQELLGNHQRSWIWGRHAVWETLRAGRWKIAELVCSEELSETDLREIQHRAEVQGIPLSWKPHADLQQLCHAPDHQGFLARMLAFPYATLPELWKATSATPFFLVLDRIQDPFNFGAMVRTAEALGVDGLLIGERFQTPVNSQVARSSAGAVNHLPIARVPELLPALQELRSRGGKVIVASEKASKPLWSADLTGPCVLVVGNEGEGVDAEILRMSDLSVAIPQAGQVASLNAAVSAGILIYEICRQRQRESSST